MQLNDRPVIGILDINTRYNSPSPTNSKDEEYSAFLHAQYVKFLETAGAIVIPIHFNNTYEETEYIMDHINGVLFTGGALSFVNPDTGIPIPYTQTAMHIYEKAMALNNRGVNFPIWGTCMGFQMLMYLRYGKEDILGLTDASHTSDPLILKYDFKNQTKLFSEFPDDIIEAVQTEPLTANFHNVGVHLDKFLDPHSNLTNYYNLLATSTDRKGLEYVASVEAIDYPFFATQFHPEVTEFTYSYNFTNHSDNAREFWYLLSTTFVGEARKNSQKFDTYQELAERTIQNNGVDFMGKTSGGSFYDNYMFDLPTSDSLISE